jgi:hypothetical protein
MFVGNLGGSPLTLGIVRNDALSAAKTEVRACMQMQDPNSRTMFDQELQEPLQYTVMVDVFFYAACSPTPMNHRFEQGFLKQQYWGSWETMIRYL